jgi:hypothetical protein
MKLTAQWFTVSLALSFCVNGCGPKEMGAKAPEFGGTGKMATTAGFVEGKWKEKDDDSMVSWKPPTLNLPEPGLFLEFRADHTCVQSGLGRVVHLTWKESGNGVDFTVLDVDGYDPATIKAGAQAEYARDQQVHSRLLKTGDMLSRDSALSAVSKRLELMPDKKRLFDSATMNPDGSSQMGVITWVRVK